MIIEKDLQKLFQKLDHDDTAKITLSGNDIFIKVFDEASKISLSTTVYNGGNFIPKSVRNGISQKSPFNHVSIKTSLAVDENQYLVNLNYLGHLEQMNNQKFTHLLEEFSWLAHAWKAYLDEHDKNDLIRVRV
ncbi:MAG: hypothetical protein HWD61_09770 [Parachlamydiaceae bacterium]|nr:MAG: hypothetical protein HWD61_09770 [Parachlamydiaceae bacterium]